MTKQTNPNAAREAGQIDLKNALEQTAKWAKLPDGTFGAEVRLARDPAEYIGRTVKIKTKAGKLDWVIIGEAVKDYGRDDITLCRIKKV